MLKKREQLIGIAQNSLASEGTVDPNLLKEIQFMVEPDVQGRLVGASKKR